MLKITYLSNKVCISKSSRILKHTQIRKIYHDARGEREKLTQDRKEYEQFLKNKTK